MQLIALPHICIMAAPALGNIHDLHDITKKIKTTATKAMAFSSLFIASILQPQVYIDFWLALSEMVRFHSLPLRDV